MSQSSSARLKILRDNITLMNRLDGYDVIIVCCSGEKQADYGSSVCRPSGGIVNKRDRSSRL
jgi:hypothetical protein